MSLLILEDYEDVKYFRLNLDDLVEFQLKEGGIAKGKYSGFRYKPNYSSLPFFEKKEAISIFPEKESSTYDKKITIVLDDGNIIIPLEEIDWNKIYETKIN